MTTGIDHSLLPSTSKVPLPAKYAEAKKKLASVAKVDECQEISDKHRALALYAKQIKDDSLEQYCKRIHARAVRRAGELLEHIAPSKGGRGKTGGDAPTRLSAAKDAGMSKDQAIQAQRVARVPEPEFDALVEGDKVASVDQIAAKGRKPAPFTKQQAAQSRANVALRAVLKKAEEFDGEFDWSDLDMLSEQSDAPELAERCERLATMLSEVAQCIRRGT